ncbi:MAG: mechanosensitive ion channel protein [Candidatus Cloacimonadota bacterium]|nr:MAG: mechanosensitive ion channel protein [Candidatus Cloacimonadota bacterium]PIE77738.1 MAG: mechanosensitive ion channel protein [Candidatus Delongbacteria bacterium]
MEKIKEFMPYIEQYALPLLLAIVIFIVGKFVARIISNFVGRIMEKKKMDTIIVQFVKKLVYIVLLIIVIMAALEKMSVNTTSFAAIIASAGLAVGLALQGSLSNFASGILLIILRPFKVGHFVEIGGEKGTVEEIHIFSTQIKSPDNKEILIPNGKVISGNIVNYSVKPVRRVDLLIGVSYEDDLKKVRKILTEVIEADERILKNPECTIGVSELADSSVNFVVRPWTKTENYWPLFFDLHEKIKIAFDENGISIPYPQRDVHIKNENNS